MKLSDTTISVVIPCYNAGTYLGETLNSVLNQTFTPLEVLVVDDGSTDDSAQIARTFGKLVRVISQKNQGECVARNHGISEAKGEWIAFLDADDIWEEDKLEHQLPATLNPDVVCVHSGFFLFGSKQETPSPPPAVQRKEYTIETLLINPLINTSTALVRNNTPLRFPTWAKQGGDMIYFTELCRFGSFVYIAAPLSGYRMHPQQITRHDNAWVSHFNNRFRWILDNQDNLGKIQTDALRYKLQEQVLEWLQLALWNRQWGRYWSLRDYAFTLDWPNKKVPDILQKRVYPRFIYYLKDKIDSLGAPKPPLKDS